VVQFPAVIITEQIAATGDVLFRWRSYLPLVLLPLFIASLADGNVHPPPIWEGGCFAVSLLGLAVRGFVVGTAPAGTSERGTRRPSAALLNTSGAYSIVRHPLYVANALIFLGLSLFPAVWYLPVIVVLTSLLYFERIAAREEAFLLQRFGSQFTGWAAAVPAMIPRLSRYRPPTTAFNLRKVITQECHGLFAIGASFFVLDTVRESFEARAFSVDRGWLIVFVATGAIFVVAILAKKLTAARPPVS
jgi:protein-S-isoprenylcysteine O-methyltransferase Ste14